MPKMPSDYAVHSCPVCGGLREVHPTLHRLSYGRQLTCSPRCKARFPALARARILAEMEQNRARAAQAAPDNLEIFDNFFMLERRQYKKAA
jgi:hypothetical protein